MNGFLKKTLSKRKLESCWIWEDNRGILTGLLTAHCHLQGHLLQLGLVNSPEQTSETSLHILCVCKTLATWRFRHPGRHIVRPGDFEDICDSKVLHLTQDPGLPNEWAEGPHRSLITTKVRDSLSAHPFIVCSNQIVVGGQEWKFWRSRQFILVTIRHCFYRYPAIFVWKWENR